MLGRWIKYVSSRNLDPFILKFPFAGPGNGVGMKVWQCYDGLDAQAWYYTDDDRIALTGKGKIHSISLRCLLITRV